MATIALLFAPQRDIPLQHDSDWFETVHCWIDAANWAWMDLWKTLPAEEQARVPRFPAGGSVSSAMSNPTRRKETVLANAARAWAENEWNTWAAAGRRAPTPVCGTAEALAAMNLDSKMSLGTLQGYAGSWIDLAPKKITRGGRYGRMRTDGDPNGFGFAEEDGVERTLFAEVVRAHGGDALAVWTFGQTLHVLVLRSAGIGQKPVVSGPYSVRFRVAAGASRRPEFLASVRAALEGSAFQPDFGALAAELAKPTLSVAGAFAAFGVPDAKDAASPDVAALWNDVETVGRALLTAGVPDKKSVGRIKNALEPLDANAKLPTKGKRGKGETSRALANAISTLERGLGFPEAGGWKERARLAHGYWDIVDCEAGARLTTGESPAGAAAALPRLLAHFPAAMLRDPLFLSMLALECEAANGHAFVAALEALAEHADLAGLVLVAVPPAQRDALRKALKVEAVDPAAGAGGAWTGEAIVSGTTLTKGDAAEPARKWLAKAKAAGLIASLSADGEVTVERFGDGVPGKTDDAALKAAALALDARAAFIALGAGDVLEPGPWHDGAYSGASPKGVEDHRAKKKRTATTLLANPPAPAPIATPLALVAALGHSLRSPQHVPENDGGFVSFRITLPGDDPDYARALRNDLKGRRLVELYGDVWVADREVWGYTCSTLDMKILAGVLADVPVGLRLAFGIANEVRGAWVLQ